MSRKATIAGIILILVILAGIAAASVFVVACSSRGCITVSQWNTTHALAEKYAQKSEQPQPSREETLTTTIRAHLVHHGFLQSPITPDDAARYRREVLQLSDDEVQEMFGVPAATYDAFVTQPLIEQEALKNQLHAETIEELYAQLADQRFVIILHHAFLWDTEKGEATAR